MVTIAIVGGVALVVVLVTRGSASQLFRLPIQSIWMVLVALAIQIFLAFVEIPSDRFDDLGLGLVMASYAFLLAFCFVNLRISMMWVIGLGIALNALVIGLNQGMPTADHKVTTRSGRTIEEPIERSAKHRPESDDDLLPFLGDRLRVPEPIDEVISIGDVVIGLGIILVCYKAGRVRRPAGSRRAERTARIAERLRQREVASQEQLPHTTGTITKEKHALSHDTPDDTLGVELDEVFARLAADDHAGEGSTKPDEDEPHEA